MNQYSFAVAGRITVIIYPNIINIIIILLSGRPHLFYIYQFIFIAYHTKVTGNMT
jgi:hypothetical protein